MADRFTYDFLLSHTVKDKPQVRGLAKALRAADLRVWFDEWGLWPGDGIDLAIEGGLKAARTQALYQSPEALGSEWATPECRAVLFRDPTSALPMAGLLGIGARGCSN